MRIFVSFCLLFSGVCVGFAAQEENEASIALANTGFEQPALNESDDDSVEPSNWFYFSSAEEGPRPLLSTQEKKSGKQSLNIKAPEQPDSYLGYAQRILVTSGASYTFSVEVLNDASNPIAGAAYGQISLEFKRADGSEIERVHGPVWASALSPTHWEKFSVTGVAPAQATLGVAVITFYSKDSAKLGSFFVDDVDLKK